MTIGTVMADLQREPRTDSTPGDEDLRLYTSTGDADAFARLVHRYVDLVYTLCVRNLGDAHGAEDVTQAVFILLARKARSIGPRVILSGWLFDTAKYCCANARRAAARRTRHETEAANRRPETAVSTPISTIEANEMGRLLHAALERMRSDERQALMLRYFERLSFADVARAMGVTEDAAPPPGACDAETPRHDDAAHGRRGRHGGGGRAGAAVA
jgi:RNA polymerase sigma factor (sigma-70 family)